jgi:hypothetical protein
MVFNMIHTAYEWKLEPSRFFEMSSQDKALMMVYSNVMSKMKAAASNSQKKDTKKSKA